ncbi:MAG: serine--tRNA ligase [Beijerinckiaceae bacterium]
MYDIRWIRENAEALKDGLRKRGQDGLQVEETVAKIFSLDDERREQIAVAQKFQEERNRLSKEIGVAMKAKDSERAEVLKAEVAALKDKSAGFEAEEADAVEALEIALAELPNIPLSDVSVGRDEKDNVEVRRLGEPPAFADDFRPKEHFEIGEALGLMDFESAARISGARFVVLKGKLARLERALIQFMLDLHADEHGYTEVNPPLLVSSSAMFGTAQLPKFADDQFWAFPGDIGGRFKFLGEADLNRTILVAEAKQDIDLQLLISRMGLIPTAEVPLTNLVREQILDEAALPLRFTAGTPCFRAEAGAAGRDTRGMIRQHQFSKVELVSIVTPEQALEEHERMTACAEEVLKRLGLHYRTMLLCTGDMGFASQKTYDIEVWLPGQQKFREISSCSVCGDFQARRMNARYRPAEGKGTRFPATLNGSGVAVGRALVAVLENYQNADGSVTVPDVLRSYMDGLERIEAVK